MPVSLVLTLLLVGVVDDNLAAAEHSFQLGVEAKDAPEFAQRHFRDAARNYAKVHAQGIHSVGLYRNWGNAALLAGNVPDAILAYHRGLRLAPGDADLRANLDLARARIDYPAGLHPPANDAWPAWLPRPGRTFFFAATALAYSLACLLISRWLLVRGSALLFRAVLCLVVAAGCGFVWHDLEARLDEERQHPLVVIATETPLYRGNGTTYPHHEEAPLLPAGYEARQLRTRGDWLQIELPGKRLGWVPRSHVLVDDL